MGAAWYEIRGRKTNLENIKEMIGGVKGTRMEACVTLGMVDAEQAKDLKKANWSNYV
jgi:biotin synthase